MDAFRPGRYRERIGSGSPTQRQLVTHGLEVQVLASDLDRPSGAIKGAADEVEVRNGRLVEMWAE